METEKSNDLILNLQKSGILNTDVSLNELMGRIDQLCEQLGATMVNDTTGTFIVKKNGNKM
ncbi:hypothetical protein [Bacillus thuringiensis]|uniref:hypothetical protein n=1 Tax=Bacillus thuringiensis TaxID=1428 RepID=UPI000BFBFC07|nr:hypothetical protein [Bacillus thuringiensis]PGU19072.1 hypothetical protein COD23_08565 [Bacillus thuringiensis]